MNIQTDANRITQAELDHIHKMTKIARVGRINAQARAEEMRKQVRILREVLERFAFHVPPETTDAGFLDIAAIVSTADEARDALEATKEKD